MDNKESAATQATSTASDILDRLNYIKNSEILAPLAEKDQLPRFTPEFLAFVDASRTEFEKLKAYCRCAIMEVQTKFNVLNEEFSLQYDRNPIETIKSRVKSDDSLVEKIIRKNIPFSIDSITENIHDLAGIRVICSFPEDIYILEKCLLRQNDITLIERKDYIQNPKANGYRSLHLIVSVPIFLQNETRDMKVEVQLRTIAMDFWASLEHKLKYKKNIPAEKAIELAEKLKECAERSSELDKEMQIIKNAITSD